MIDVPLFLAFVAVYVLGVVAGVAGWSLWQGRHG